MNQPFDAFFQFHERAVIGDVGDAAIELGLDRVLQFDAVPRIGFELLHAQRNTLVFDIKADHLDVHGLADLQRLGRMIDTLPGNIGDVQQAVDAAQINKGAIIGDVLDDAF